jgi:hypothetical protein
MDRKKCSEVSHWRDHMRRKKPCQSSLSEGRDASLFGVSRLNGQNGDELGQPATGMAKLYELRAARSRRCEESLR